MSSLERNNNISIANHSILNNTSLLEQIKIDIKDIKKDIEDLQVEIKFIKDYCKQKKEKEDKKWF